MFSSVFAHSQHRFTDCNNSMSEVVDIVAAVILAGGLSRRMGRDKLTLTLGGVTLLESVASRFEEEFKDVFISVADTGKYPDIAVRKIADILPGAGPISGLHAALTVLPCDGVFLAAADLPYACPRAAKRIIELSEGYDACIVRLPDGKLEPLFGYYRKTLLPGCFDLIMSGNNRMSALISGANARFVSPEDLGELWSDKLIVNINYPEDYNKLVGG